MGMTRTVARLATAVAAGSLATALAVVAPAGAAVAPAGAVVGPAGAVAAPAGASRSSCATAWGSTPERVTTMSTAAVTGVRAGRHACFDRLVVDLRGTARGYSVSYLPEVRMDGSGAAVPVRGGARLAVVVTAPAYDQNGIATYQPANRRELVPVTGWQTFRQVAWAGSFEGYTTLALGVRARLPFRVFVLPGQGGTSRLVVDVAHRW
jgi:hypothetical protein